MKKIKLKNKKKIKIGTKITIILILLMISTFLFLNYCGQKVLPTIMSQAEINCKKMAVLVIKNSVNDEVLSTIDDNLYSIVQNNNGEIQTIDFNSIEVNKFLSKTTNIVSENLKKLEKGEIDNISFIDDSYDLKKLKNGVISEIPMGIISNNVLLSNLGPKIPVRLNLIGNAVSSIETNVRNYGINSVLIEVIAKVEVTEQVIIPFQTKTIKINNDIPIAIKIVNGSVPQYYSNGKINESSNILSIPIENDLIY